MKKLKYPIGIQTFESIRKDGYVYVDKTRHIYELVSSGKYYFLSRPRRFGKSLLLSTIEAYFSGRKDLFEGLDIAELEKEWESYPVLHIDLNTADYIQKDALGYVLNKVLSNWEEKYGRDESEKTMPLRFLGIVERAATKTGKNVVILIDEYDKPILQAIAMPELQDEYRRQLKAFYSVLKTQDRFIKFAFVTGVTKFGKVSIFSDLNNLKDISMDRRYVDICGITEDEIQKYFSESIKELADSSGKTIEEVRKELKDRYDGYHFKQGTIGIYNPYSLLNTLDYMDFGDYWFETGTPTFLVELLKNYKYKLPDLTKEQLSDDAINSIDSTSRNPIPMIYQSGYLTITGYNERFKKYRLGFPNKEVEEGFLNFLLPSYSPRGEKSSFYIEEFVNDLESGSPEQFMQRLKAFFADTSYQVVGDAELYFQNVMYLIFKIMGFYIQVERTTSSGRIDAVIQTQDYIYVIECKLDKTAEEDIKQIEGNCYAQPFITDKRKLFKIGVNFDSESRGVGEYLIS